MSSIVPLNVPNVLTLVRIVLVPVMVLAIARDDTGALTVAALIFVVAAVTDAADGYLARSLNLITRFGRLADPVADKLLVGAALASLVAVDRLAAWIAAVVVLREVAVTALRWHAGTEGITLHVSALGKLKTGAQMTAIPLLMLVPDPSADWIAPVLAAVVLVTIASGVDYALTYLRQTAGTDRVATVARW